MSLLNNMFSVSDDELLYRFLHTCYFSLEKTKKYIDTFCTTRALMPEVYTKRDPLLPDVKSVIDRTYESYNFIIDMKYGPYLKDKQQIFISNTYVKDKDLFKLTTYRQYIRQYILSIGC